MKDILNLTDVGIPIQKRYDEFLLWSNSHSSIIPDVIADQIKVDSSVVDVFLVLGELEDEFDIINEKKIDVSALFLIVRCKKEVRLKIYDNAEVLLAESQPMHAIRKFIEKASSPDFTEVINMITAKTWKIISNYIKQRKIESGTISDKFPNMLAKCSTFKTQGKLISEPMCEWIIRAIVHDKEHAFGIFTNVEILNHSSEDFNYFEMVMSKF
jgi:hypothetical protein